MLSSSVGYWLYHKKLDLAGRLAREKRSNLFDHLVIGDEKSLIKLTPGFLPFLASTQHTQPATGKFFIYFLNSLLFQVSNTLAYRGRG